MNKTLINYEASIASILAVALSTGLQAQSIDSEQVCQKIKTCAVDSPLLKQMAEQQRQLILGQLDAQCAKSFKDREQALIEAGLSDQANACAQEMLDLPCGDLLSPSVLEKSKACAALEKASKKAGIE